MKKYEHLLKPLQIGKLTVKNRFQAAPIGSFYLTAGPKGEYNVNTIEYLTERARGGFGLIVLGNVAADMEVDKPNIIDGQIPPLYAPKTWREAACRLTDRVHFYGTKIFMQIGMGHGRMRDTEKAPSAVPKLHHPDVLTEALTAKEIETKIHYIIETAKLAKSAGFDGVEVHAMHWGYLLDQFAMAITNHRTDEYGGDLYHRLTAVRKIVTGIKEACGKDYPVSIRFGMKSYMKGFNQASLHGDEEAGRTIEEACEIGKLLEEFGFDMLNCNSGVYDAFYYCAPPTYLEKGYNIKLSRELKKHVSIPVYVAGRMDDPDLCEQAIADGDIDGVALARASLADPHYAKKIEMGLPEQIHPCISCQNCMASTFSKGSPTCAVNPAGMKEDIYGFEKACIQKKVAVIGGGVAGMEAARIASMRGHTVDLYEKTDRLGGYLYEAGVHSFKGPVRDLNAWYELQLKKANVMIHMNSEITPDRIRSMGVDTVILATGSTPLMPGAIKGIDSPKAASCVDVLNGTRKVGDNVIIVGGGLVGAEMAYDFCLEGKKVTIVEALDDILANDPNGVPPQVHDMLRDLLDEYNCTLLLGNRLEEINEEGCIVSAKDGTKQQIQGSDVIMAIGFRGRPSMAEELYGEGIEIFRIAPVNGIGNISSEVGAAYEIARKL